LIEKYAFFTDNKFQLKVGFAQNTITNLCALLDEQFRVAGTDAMNEVERKIALNKRVLSDYSSSLSEIRGLIDLISTELGILKNLTNNVDLKPTTAQCVRSSAQQLDALKGLLSLIATWIEKPVESDYKGVPTRVSHLIKEAHHSSQAMGFHDIISELDDCLGRV
jgi:hypothetical protein